MRTLFLDTSAVIALEDVGDRNHAAALSLVAQSRRQGLRFVTSNFILDEAYTWFCGHYQARMRVADGLLRSPRVTYQRVEPIDEHEALELGRRLRDKDFSFTDLTSFAMMTRLGIRRAFSFDRHFRQFGRFEVLP